MQRCRRNSPALQPSQKCCVSGVGDGNARGMGPCLPLWLCCGALDAPARQSNGSEFSANISGGDRYHDVAPATVPCGNAVRARRRLPFESAGKAFAIVSRETIGHRGWIGAVQTLAILGQFYAVALMGALVGSFMRKFTGRFLTPLTKADSENRAGPANSICSTRARNSRRNAASSIRARFRPRQR